MPLCKAEIRDKAIEYALRAHAAEPLTSKQLIREAHEIALYLANGVRDGEGRTERGNGAEAGSGAAEDSGHAH
jgi:hypothetical protein